MTFNQLALSEKLVAALPGSIEQPTEIQRLAIPIVLANHDLLALAQTGSGKTLAFGLPLLQLVQPQYAQIQALIIVPTRELATQISDTLQPLARALELDVVTLCGGVCETTQLTNLAAGAQLIVATPGRLLDLLQRKLIASQAIAHLVFDEVDRLLEMGFWPDIQRILALLPSSRQTLMFSATLSPKLEQIADLLLDNPQRLQIHSANSVVENIQEQLYLVNKGSKAKVLQWLLQQNDWQQVLVFISGRDSVDAFAKKMAKAGIEVAALHGSKNQQERQDTLNAFLAQKLRVLVTTDVLARGIDIESLPVVINLDLPENAPLYVHRVGRTARAGKTGLAISLVSHGEMDTLEAIRTLTARELPLSSLALFPVTDKPASATSKRPPRDKKANRRSVKRRNDRDSSR